MDRQAVAELFDYTGWAWQRLARTIDELPAEAFEVPVGDSGWPSVAACLSHVVSNYDYWLNGPWSRLRLGEMSYPGKWPAPINDWSEMVAYRERVRESFQRAVDVSDDVLYERAFRDSPQGDLISRADVLANLLLHERGHHGDLTTLFHGLGRTSYFLDFMLFRSQPNEFVADDGEH